MQFVTSQYTRHTNDRVGRDGPLFRGRFHSIVVDDDDYLARVARYIHRNPLTLDGVASPEQYRWSSHRTYLGRRRCPPWLRRELVLSLFGGDPIAFGSFVSGDPGGGESSIDPQRVLVAAELTVDEWADTVGRARQGLARTVALLISDRVGGVDGRRIVDQLGIVDQTSHDRAMTRARRQSRAHPVLEEIVARTIQLAA
jgi:hypothetical protein